MFEIKVLAVSGTGRGAMQGMTPVELLVVVTIALVLLFLVVPSFWDISVDVKRSAVISNIGTSVLLARSEALKRRSSVAICPSRNGEDCLPGEQPEWNRGWIVFLDSDADRQLDQGEERLRVFSFEHPIHSMTGSAGLQRGILFRPDGLPDTPGQLNYCETEGSNPQSNTIDLNVMGRVKVETADGGCP